MAHDLFDVREAEERNCNLVSEANFSRSRFYAMLDSGAEANDLKRPVPVNQGLPLTVTCFRLTLPRPTSKCNTPIIRPNSVAIVLVNSYLYSTASGRHSSDPPCTL